METDLLSSLVAVGNKSDSAVSHHIMVVSGMFRVYSNIKQYRCVCVE